LAGFSGGDGARDLMASGTQKLRNHFLNRTIVLYDQDMRHGQPFDDQSEHM
jgi:hypothetical protein